MNFKITLLFSSSLLFFFCCANAFNITHLLNNHSDFSTFNNLLTQTGLAGDINSRRTITVLAVENSALSSVQGKSSDLLKYVLSVHIVLDYYDVSKLEHLPNKSMILTTLFQSSGRATGDQGFLNVTSEKGGNIMFGSAAKGSTNGANLVKSIASQPYNLSVLQVSSVIVPNGIENANSPGSAPAPGPTGRAKPPSKSHSPGPSRDAPSSDAPAPSPSNAPASAPPMASGGPMADAPAADAPGKSGATAPGLSSIGLVLMIVSSTSTLATMIW